MKVGTDRERVELANAVLLARQCVGLVVRLRDLLEPDQFSAAHERLKARVPEREA